MAEKADNDSPGSTSGTGTSRSTGAGSGDHATGGGSSTGTTPGAGNGSGNSSDSSSSSTSSSDSTTSSSGADHSDARSATGSSTQTAAPSSGASMASARESDRRSVYSYSANSPVNEAREVVSKPSYTGAGFTTVKMDDGSIVRADGTRADRNNNPGNLEYGGFAQRHGAIGTDGRFAVFSSPEQGKIAQESLVFSDPRYTGKSISDAISMYAPPHENDTGRYAAIAAEAAGVSPSTRISELTPDQRSRMAEAMRQHEGYRAGSVRTTTLREGTGFPSAAEQASDFGAAGRAGGLMSAATPQPAADPFAGMAPTPTARPTDLGYAPDQPPGPPPAKPVERFRSTYLAREPVNPAAAPPGAIRAPQVQNGYPMREPVNPAAPAAVPQMREPVNPPGAAPQPGAAPVPQMREPANPAPMTAGLLNTARAPAPAMREPMNPAAIAQAPLASGPTSRPNNGGLLNTAPAPAMTQDQIGRRVTDGYLDAFGGQPLQGGPQLGNALEAAIANRNARIEQSLEQARAQEEEPVHYGYAPNATPPGATPAPAISEPPREVAGAGPARMPSAPPLTPANVTDGYGEPGFDAAEDPELDFNWSHAATGAMLGGSVAGPLGMAVGGIFGGYAASVAGGARPDAGFVSKYLGGGGDGSGTQGGRDRFTGGSDEPDGGRRPRSPEPKADERKPKRKPKTPEPEVWRPAPAERFGENWDRYS